MNWQDHIDGLYKYLIETTFTDANSQFLTHETFFAELIQHTKLGMAIVTLSGMRADNPLKKMGHFNAYVPAPTYGFVETSHAALLHFWMDNIQAAAFPSAKRGAA